MLRAIAGLDRPASGSVTLGEEVWFDSATRVWVQPERRSVGFVFQDYALFPHLTVRDNVAFGGRERVDDLLDRLRIAHLAKARPGDLSGGERQRVALGRALARNPRVLLLDEPMAALDAHTRATVRAELRELLGELRLPTLVVSHDFDDASALANRVAVLEAGRIVQMGSPATLIVKPASPFVASLTGANLMEGEVDGEVGDLTAVRLPDGTVMRSPDSLRRGRAGVVVQPTDISIARTAPGGSAQNHVEGRIASIVLLGGRSRVQIGPLTAEVTSSSVETSGWRRANGQWRLSRRSQPAWCRSDRPGTRTPRR